MTTDHPRQQLHYIITHYGHSVCNDLKRCEALLKDLCPQHKREVNLLMGALREGIAKELLKPNQLLPMETVISRLSQKLHDELGFEVGLAQWAVESWTFALGIKFKAAIAPSPVGAGSPQTATPTNHAAALQPIKQQQVQSRASQAIIDQFKGWQKIGLRGEKLAVDAPQWAAVIDEKTNLMWAVNPSKTADFPNPKELMIWKDAMAWTRYVNTQGWCGFKDWRLPAIQELKSLVTKTKRPNLFIREDIFNDIHDKDYNIWSSSPMAFYGFNAWIVNFYYGSGLSYNKYNNYYVRLVRSSQ